MSKTKRAQLSLCTTPAGEMADRLRDQLRLVLEVREFRFDESKLFEALREFSACEWAVGTDRKVRGLR